MRALPRQLPLTPQSTAHLYTGPHCGPFRASSTTNEVCITTSTDYQTGAGSPIENEGDLFVGSALEYQYGKYRTSSAGATCAAPGVSIEEEVVFALTGNATQKFIYTEHTILNLIDQLIADIATLTAGTQEYLFAQDQLEVWQQSIALNAELKAAATDLEVLTWSGDSESTFNSTGSSSEGHSLEMNVYVEGTFGLEMGISAGGSGVTLGAQARMRQNIGSVSSSSTSSSTTVGYHFADDNPEDVFTVHKRIDPVFGTAVFEIQESSITSCPYEGGYQIDQPELMFADGSTELTMNDIPTGSDPTFEISVCNESTYGRYYNLKVNPATNTGGAEIFGFGENLSATDEGFSIWVDAGDCIDDVIITFSQVTESVLDYEGVELYLYAACQPVWAPIYESIFINMHFVDEANSITDVHAPVQFSVYPNPTTGDFNVTLSALVETGTLTLLDAAGRAVTTWNVATGNTQHVNHRDGLAAGVYILQLTTGTQQFQKRLIVR